MSPAPSPPAAAPAPDAPPTRSAAGALAGAVLAGSWLAAPFVGAGTLAWFGGWVYLGLVLSGLAGYDAYARRVRARLVPGVW